MESGCPSPRSSAMKPNLASLRVLKKLGFVYGGRQREAVRRRGRSMDMVLYGLLRGELVPWASLTLR